MLASNLPNKIPCTPIARTPLCVLGVHCTAYSNLAIGPLRGYDNADECPAQAVDNVSKDTTI